MSVDLEFPGSQHVYGLPERATNLSLEATAGDALNLAAVAGVHPAGVSCWMLFVQCWNCDDPAYRLMSLNSAAETCR